MRIASLLTVSRSIPCISGRGGLCPTPPPMQTPAQMQTLRIQDPPPPDVDPPVMWPVMHSWEANYPLPAVDRMADACENINLHQTSFAGSIIYWHKTISLQKVALFLLLVHRISDQIRPCNCFAQIHTYHVPFFERDFEIQVIYASPKIEKKYVQERMAMFPTNNVTDSCLVLLIFFCVFQPSMN